MLILMKFFARFIKCCSLISRSKYLPFYAKNKLSKVLSHAMSQKSILSFFKITEQNSVKDSKSKSVVENNLIKNIKKEEKSHSVENADKISLNPNKELNGESRRFSDGEGKKLPDESPKKDEKVFERNGDIASEKQNEINGVEKRESTKLPHSPEKDNSKSKDDVFTEKNEEIVPPIEAIEKPSTSSENDTLIIPKRKTARKQMNSGRDITKDDSKQEKVVFPSESTGKDIESKDILKSNETKKNEDVENETKEKVNTESVPEKKETIKEVDKPCDLKQPENKRTINVSKKAKDSPLKKSVKKETIHSFFNSVKSDAVNNDIEVKKDKSLPMETNDSPIKKEENDTKEQIKYEENDDSPLKKAKKGKLQLLKSDEESSPVKKESDDSPIKKVKKRKLQLLESDEESSPVKKLVKVKVEGDRSKKKKREVKTEESPTKEIKKLKSEDTPSKKGSKKKAQRLESENESAKSPIKNETASTQVTNDPILSEEKEGVTVKVEQSSGDKVSEAKNSPSTVPSDTTSKSDKEKKFGVKSTSATDTVYNPAKNNYHPIDDAFWKHKEKTPYLALAKTLELIENTSGRLKTIEILANFFRSVVVLSPDDFLHSIYLCLNRVAPEYEGIEMGVGETLLMKAVAQATGRTVDKIKAEVAIKGDLGLVSESSRGNQRVMFAPPKLTVSAVFNKFREIAKMSGNTAMSKKIDKIKGLFVACRDCEAKYIIRSLSGKLRIGLAEQSILSAIARASVLTPGNQTYPPEIINASDGMSPNRFKELLDSKTLILKTAYCECPNYDLIVPVLLKEGISALPEHCQLSPGVPLKPMLAHPTAGVDIVLARFDKNAFTCEFKYDGERAQIHSNEKGAIKIFSRNQEDNTSKYPDIISLLPEVINESTKSFILDSEAVAYDREKKQILPFQVLSTRKRKDAVESEITVQVCVMAFDLLYLNGQSLVKKPLKERRSLLHSSFKEIEGKFMFALYRDGDNAETMQEFLDESVKGNCEGLMVKALEVDASYEIAKRSHNWLKLKKDYLQGIGDTLDLVVIGGYYGKGKRTGNYGGFLLACYDSENEEFQSICKLGTGFKDDNLEAHTKFLKQHVIKEPKKYYSYDSGLEPDEWFEPVQVWEIKCADLSISPVHRAAIGIVDPKRGISLRFPRFVKIREDKSVEDATSSSQIADMYRNQQQIQNTSSSNSNIEEDFY